MENVIERAVIVSRSGKLHLDLPETTAIVPNHHVSSPQKTTPSAEENILTEQQRQQRDRDMIIKALLAADGKVFGAGGAAEILGLKPTTLASRMKRYGIQKDMCKSRITI